MESADTILYSSINGRLLKTLQHWCSFVVNNVTDQIRGILRLRVIPVACSRLDTVDELISFLKWETATILSSSIVIALSWMSFYYTRIPSILPFINTLIVLAFIVRRWYYCDEVVGENNLSNHFLLKLRMAKLIGSCLCTLISLLAFLIISLNSISKTMKKGFLESNLLASAFQMLSIFRSPNQTFDESEYFNYNAHFPSTVFLVALECVLLTDIVSNVIHMTRSSEYKMALINEGPLVILGMLKISLGVWIFNILNEYFIRWEIEMILMGCIGLWVGAVLLDFALYYKENTTPRTIDLFGYRMIQDICWYQVDVNVVAYSIIILLFSQWKISTSLLQRDEMMIFENFEVPLRIKELLTPFSFFTGSAIKAMHLEETHHQRPFAQLNSEIISLLIMIMISFRFKTNFDNSYQISTFLRNTRWNQPIAHAISARNRHSRKRYDRNVAFRLLWANNQNNEYIDIEENNE